MKRKLAKKGLLVCASCGSSNVYVVKNSETLKYHVICDDCGKQSLGADTENEAIKGWNRAYAISLD